jgi:hypothetical protein
MIGIAQIASGQMEELQSLANKLAEKKNELDVVKLEEDGRSAVSSATLGKSTVEHQDRPYDGLRFTAPLDLEGRDFIWYFNAPEGWANWYIVPLEEEVKQGFKNWLNADMVYKDLDKEGAKERMRVLQTLDGSYFEPGKEYALWFRNVEKAKPGELRFRIAFAKPEEKGKWEHGDLEQALGLEAAAAEAQVAELDSLGGKILMDEKFFDKEYAEGRIDAVFSAKRQQQILKGGFFIQIRTSTPPCRRNPKLAEIMAKHGEPDFVRTSKETASLTTKKEDDDPPTVTHFYDYFGFVVNEGDGDQIVQQVTAQANNFSKLIPKDSGRWTFGRLGYENLMVFHQDGREVGRIYFFDEEDKDPNAVKVPPLGAYRNGSVTVKCMGDGKWTMEGVSEEGKPLFLKRYEKNRLHGISETYHDNEKLRLSLSYNNGVLDGNLIEYDEEGKIVREARYKEGNEIE